VGNTRKCVAWRIRHVEVIEAFEFDTPEIELRDDPLKYIPNNAVPVLIKARDRSRVCDGFVLGGLQDNGFLQYLADRHLYAGIKETGKEVAKAGRTVSVHARSWGEWSDFD